MDENTKNKIYENVILYKDQFFMVIEEHYF